MPNAALALEEKGRVPGAYALLFRSEIANKVTFVSRLSDEILEKVGVSEDAFVEEVKSVENWGVAAWLKFFQNFSMKDCDIWTYLSGCSIREKAEVENLHGASGLKFFLGLSPLLSPFDGYQICVHTVPEVRKAFPPFSTEHVLAQIAADAGAILPGQRVVIGLSSQKGYKAFCLFED